MARAGLAIELDAIDWAQIVNPGDLVVWGQASDEPAALTGSLVASRARIGRFRAFIGISFGDVPDLAHTDVIRFSSYCGTAQNRRLGAALDILPVHYSALAPTLSAQHPVLLLSLAPGTDAEHFSFGAGGDYLADLIPTARIVIAQVSRHTPQTGGGRDIRRDAIDLVIHTDAPPLAPGVPRIVPAAAAAESEIARRLAAIIEDGSVIQTGLGSIPAAVLKALTGHRDLGIHSGLIGDEVVDLVEAGVVTNARKTIDHGVTVTGLLSGSVRLMHWAHRNPALAIRPTSHTHDFGILSAIDRLVAINSAIEVDLTGQINAEVAGGRYLGAIGGAPAFLRGAAASRGGLPIIALPSTAGQQSRIVAQLSGPVSTARCDVGLVATEYGVVDLRTMTLAQRRDALIGIAHPDHRAMLDTSCSG